MVKLKGPYQCFFTARFSLLAPRGLSCSYWPPSARSSIWTLRLGIFFHLFNLNQIWKIIDKHQGAERDEIQMTEHPGHPSQKPSGCTFSFFRKETDAFEILIKEACGLFTLFHPIKSSNLLHLKVIYCFFSWKTAVKYMASLIKYMK